MRFILIVRLDPVGIFNFQFSLWDSTVLGIGKYGVGADFQFSLWDSFELWPVLAWPERVFFQFSLWDSWLLLIIPSHTRSGLTLSILFMRFLVMPSGQCQTKLMPFNSLYEILNYWGFMITKLKSFNSLYEIRLAVLLLM